MMKRVRIRSVEDLEALPEDEWVKVIGGINAKWVEEPEIEVDGETLIVPLPPRIRRQFKLGKGEVLQARISRGNLIVELEQRQRARRAK